ncbi:MAG: hypothetical protein A2268_08885 [Candidatus Raymondbacteria bacterium RifOxyA12_full_50_37]|uniref:Methyltransferase type 11 domain-containing protein n=1 Tax=Candidatus Raymondbacteria bacterium RIFOXYD12_FULL_49_13 TaxID=1817890 RepID=A0A1F7FGH5_UNCRA|nr:MAG: hypothetical protein A2350_19805 [Candidatus Raymondbacteria bacterium RifOxyB12_full_50_8]OGJ91607.1 MAG: hypothetical protein A2268_08885 [Candidatus Raymondbacteria bacterium RifOxyA12_full_50_37]OGJ92913.1 MAG: hypothetical protein A2248_08585 [Candidatus Raymondbacteria bacterium RIFOXYA2_FULL_49_16]OGJ94839.1 MAG: hypothetical protein A2487_03285 [Candidatus Raymondbacteria bacterium RifOxyC12_full_50_8]OGK05701.1 MAG: hypothetical protein A2519_03885 [Candidatus Raymondbacteria b
MESQEERELSEITYWRDSTSERPESGPIDNLINKMTDCGVFEASWTDTRNTSNRQETVLELGGGQGWASCERKKVFPHLKVILTNISEYAIASKPKWEHVFNVSLDNAYACTSYKIPEASSSMDVVFCFAAAHHFAELAKQWQKYPVFYVAAAIAFSYTSPPRRNCSISLPTRA